MQKSTNSSIVALCILLFQSTPAIAKSLDECAAEGGRHTSAAVAVACIAGKSYTFEHHKKDEDKGNDIKGHEFRSKPIKVSKNGNETTITGSLVHLVRFSRDEEVKYEITRVGTNLISIKTDIDHGGWAKITGPIASIVASIPGVPLPEDQLKDVSKQINQAVGNAHDWRLVAKAIVLEVAIRAK